MASSASSGLRRRHTIGTALATSSAQPSAWGVRAWSVVRVSATESAPAPPAMRASVRVLCGACMRSRLTTARMRSRRRVDRDTVPSSGTGTGTVSGSVRVPVRAVRERWASG